MTETRFIVVGKLGKTRGVHGEIYVTPMTDFPERFVEQKEIYLDIRGNWVKYKIESGQLIGGRPVLKFENIDSPEEAARLTNLILAIPREELTKLPEDSFYIFDLIGCRVVDESDEEIGEITDVQQQPANDVYVIRRPDKTEWLLPAVKSFVIKIDIENKTVVIDKAGLFTG